MVRWRTGLSVGQRGRLLRVAQAVYQGERHAHPSPLRAPVRGWFTLHARSSPRCGVALPRRQGTQALDPQSPCDRSVSGPPCRPQTPRQTGATEGRRLDLERHRVSIGKDHGLRTPRAAETNPKTPAQRAVPNTPSDPRARLLARPLGGLQRSQAKRVSRPLGVPSPMTKLFKGRIDIDIRDSVPYREPYAQPKAATIRPTE